MEDMNDMLGSLLSDPESMQQIKELADMLKSEMPSDGKSGESGQNGQSSQGGFDFGSLAGLMGGQFDPNMLTAVSKVLAAMNGEDKNRALLMALRPHLSGDMLVHTLVMAADKQDAVLMGELLGHRLAKGLARRGEEDGIRGIVGASQLIKGLKEGLALHEHALPAAVRRVVNCTMPVMSPIAQVMRCKLKVTRLTGPAHDGQGHDGLKHLGKDAEGLDTNGHGSTPRAGCREGA